jgi:hypothetical protein
MPELTADEMKMLNSFRGLSEAKKKAVAASQSAFTRWLKEDLPAIWNSIKDFVSSAWNAIRDFFFS